MYSIQKNQIEKIENQSIYIVGGIFTIIALIGILLDVIIGNITGGNLLALPQSAVDRFIQLQQNPLLGLYNLDFLNIINQMIMIITYFALFITHSKTKNPYALLAFIIFIIGSTIFVTNNVALQMLELSNKYTSSVTESQKLLFAAAGEGLLARGAHGSLGVLIGFALPNIAGIIMSFVMLKEKVFGKLNSYIGIIGSFLMTIYVVLVAIVPSVKGMATLFAMPGGLLCMTWMIMFTIRFFKLGFAKK